MKFGRIPKMPIVLEQQFFGISKQIKPSLCFCIINKAKYQIGKTRIFLSKFSCKTFSIANNVPVDALAHPLQAPI